MSRSIGYSIVIEAQTVIEAHTVIHAHRVIHAHAHRIFDAGDSYLILLIVIAIDTGYFGKVILVIPFKGVVNCTWKSL